ncbi:PAS domain-containing methyl-accepting chemotaxis protein [Pokkaliibacter sp. MBI-7]|uniref:methyl-accepting chemotaxis protein n=1 Tax=Pokkaliibacter sp. MBI-7 TaxID=3040600 RepID=UPI002449BC1B|nr:PAS domain-containing methyl-accepting chemotaxis protein [Pokkaliibacter sp. MBI-7]MDH2431086.1 PAS domain-containing methyl-accepting chemotaxis protein [Pokkaliibacter sp. MBI-7]
MKKNLPVTEMEVTFFDRANILSTTDLKGAITYVNDDFITISGFDEEELIGKNHNIVRHPEMPPAAFQMLWESLKKGKSWMGLVKNRCKNGDHYWVHAYATPIERNGAVAEYQSVRRKADKEHVRRAEWLYPQLMAGKSPSAIRPGLSLNRKMQLYFTLIWWLSFALLLGLVTERWMVLASIGVAGWLCGVSCLGWLLRPMSQLAERARAIRTDAVAQYVYAGRNDDVGQIDLALTSLEAEAAAIVGRIADSSSTLRAEAAILKQTVEDTGLGVENQFSKTNLVATAINEMSASIQEVNVNAGRAAEAAAEARSEADRGNVAVMKTRESITLLANEVQQASAVIEKLEGDTANITNILAVIRGIAEQTNLLALNAAIEAARAGEQGRGFAVVADEVRALATRTHESTEEIQQMLSNLQTGAHSAVSAMKTGQVQARETVTQVGNTVHVLEAINNAIATITEMSSQIATAVEQQSDVAEEINRNVVNIRDISLHTRGHAEHSGQASQTMQGLAQGLLELSAQFWNSR